MTARRFIRSPRRRGREALPADPTKAIDIIKVGGTADDGDDFEDLGRESGTLLSALSLQPGQFTRT